MKKLWFTAIAAALFFSCESRKSTFIAESDSVWQAEFVKEANEDTSNFEAELAENEAGLKFYRELGKKDSLPK